MNKIILCSMICLAVCCCKTQQKRGNNATGSVSKVASQTQSFAAALPHVLIYKTAKDYAENVPVILSDDKTQIVSYPHPSDLKTEGGFAYPTKLNNGYLLDNRGTGKNVAFLKFTYEEYSKLRQVPALDVLYNSIIDKNPLLELWDCGTRASYTDLVTQLNALLNSGQLEKKCFRF